MERKHGIGYNTDHVATEIFSRLRDDFLSSNERIPYSEHVLTLRRSPKDFRDLSWKEFGLVDPYFYKQVTQLESLLKKYRFEHDKYTEEELEDKTIKSYVEFQSTLRWQLLKPYTVLVLKEARRIIREILADVSLNEIVDHVRFGKKSSIGCSYSKSYIDYKLTEPRAFTSSSRILDWFNCHILADDPVLGRIVRRLRRRGIPPSCTKIDHLNLINVPKSWKTLRTITPLTLLGLHYSYGIGGVITERLKNAGLDIRYLQEKHRKLAKQFSSGKCSHVTADLSRASDSITKELLMHLLPRKWWNLIKVSLTHQVVCPDGKRVYTQSVLPMGNGFTFPLETLVFYSLIKAVGHLAKRSGVFSVYGDDLIYPRSIHSYVYKVFLNLNIRMNLEKTYAHFPFRESCGGDYYRGHDVRPFILPDSHAKLSPARYCAFLYKCINGLLRRWDKVEIPLTIHFLLNEVVKARGQIHQVPTTFPEDSGVRVERPVSSEMYPFEVVRRAYRKKSGCYVYFFTCLRRRPKHRFVVEEECYYWLKLSGKADSLPEHNSHVVDTDLLDTFQLIQHRGKVVPTVSSKTEFTSFKHQVDLVFDWI